MKPHYILATCKNLWSKCDNFHFSPSKYNNRWAIILKEDLWTSHSLLFKFHQVTKFDHPKNSDCEQSFQWSYIFMKPVFLNKIFWVRTKPFWFYKSIFINTLHIMFWMKFNKILSTKFSKIGYGLTVLLNILRLEKATAQSNTYSWLAKCIEWYWQFVICRYPCFTVSISWLWVRLVNSK